MGDRGVLPDWAVWNTAAAERPWSVGLEEEIVLVEPGTGAVANRIGDVLRTVPLHVASHATAETHACVLEMQTAPHGTAARAAGELADLRQSLAAALRDRLGLHAVAAGTHPLASAEQVQITQTPRYREIAATTRAMARREPTMALHVHVAVPDAEAAVRALDGMRADLPVLLALSANSPYWRGLDSGYAAVRIPILSGFPRVGIPRAFGGYREYVAAIEPLVATGAIPEPHFLWWDARLQPALGTIEVRIMDAQTRIRDVAALAALVQCLVMLRAQGRPPAAMPDEVVAENRFLAARDGIDAALVDPVALRRVPARDALDGLLDACHGIARLLRCDTEFADVAELAAAPGHRRQRERARAGGPAALMSWLVAEFADAERVVAAVA